MSLNCLACSLIQRTDSYEDLMMPEKESVATKLRVKVDRSWSFGNIGSPASGGRRQCYDGENHGLKGGALANIKTNHRRFQSDGNVGYDPPASPGPRLVRSCGVRRDWSFEDLMSKNLDNRVEIHQYFHPIPKCDHLPSGTGHPFGDGCQLLQIELHNGIRKETRVLLRVTLGHIHHVRFQNDGPDLAFTLEAVHRRYGAIIPEPVLSPNDTKTRDVSVIVQYIKPLRAGSCRACTCEACRNAAPPTTPPPPARGFAAPGGKSIARGPSYRCGAPSRTPSGLRTRPGSTRMERPGGVGSGFSRRIHALWRRLSLSPLLCRDRGEEGL
ncbi:putative plant/MZA15-19 protein [Senna tora]|uniref:Putative plant/MZA15-19 protein n=1 Tax=Senna tora TaxID=362788 RepID=A0A834SS84_9FABA|nr:putative plant/MZA15-19 protein [Senna tora]